MTTAPAAVLLRSDIPVEETWDLTDYYASDATWQEAAEAVGPLVESAAAFRGRLTESVETLKLGLDAVMTAQEALSRLFTYAALRSDEDITNTDTRAMRERATRIATEAGAKLAFIEPEILAAPEDQLTSLIAAPDLDGYRHLLEDLARKRAHTRSIEVEELLAQSADIARSPREIFDALDDADLEYGTVKDEDGNEIALTKATNQVLLESKNRDVRRAAWTQFMGAYTAHKETLATAHAASVRKDVFYAGVRNYPSARDAALDGDAIPGSVYDSLIEAVREAKPVMERYANLRRRLLGLDQLAMYDNYVPLSALPEAKYGFDEAVDIVLDSLQPLGPEYVSRLEAGLRGRWVDQRESKGKASGAYSWGSYRVHPVILMNWNGTLDTVFTLAHEAGHAMHSLLAGEAQPFHYAHYSIFTAEIASTVNEVLLTWRLLDKTPELDYEQRFSIINRLVDGIQSTLVRQTQFAEFERETHARYERGEALTLEWMSQLYSSLQEVYVPATEIDENVSLTWARVPHFYRAFYVFQYATGMASALALASQIRDEGAPAAARYLDMLRSGGADYPLPLLQKAGVDLTTPEPVRSAMREYDRLVGEMEAIAIKSGRITE
jgi:oligoendopeptidase F